MRKALGVLPVCCGSEAGLGILTLRCRNRYLAARTGHKCVRINNHEHTDLQEYVGTYVTNSDGKLVFQEGALVTAMREGSWIILDELNLAPTEVLEALNRLLDDNRELFIAETLETVRLNRFRVALGQGESHSHDNNVSFVFTEKCGRVMCAGAQVKPHPNFMLWATQNPAGAYGGRAAVASPPKPVLGVAC